MKLLLFDIDGTLVDCGGAGSRSLQASFAAMFGVNNAFDGISMAGKTDPQIIRESLTRHGIPHDGLIPDLLKIYIANLQSEILQSDKKMMPGVVQTLEAFAGRPNDYISGILTGNIEAGARIKLNAFKLNSYFRTGAYGSDHEERNNLLPFALERFKKIADLNISFKDCVIIGDTPRDVECAKLHGAHCIGVATGPYEFSDLVSAGADHVFETLEDTESLLSAVSSL
ncbi:MAG: HAD hydrolase-like protein [Dissulfurispiraceae bacterium]|jgi:phosphoglycolate phosphatase-like HAD superfamily hydrolase|nr:HAD hydrolase-like protein [Dissulfurispiraceae bacterium]